MDKLCTPLCAFLRNNEGCEFLAEMIEVGKCTLNVSNNNNNAMWIKVEVKQHAC